jgi:hypothetical protein
MRRASRRYFFAVAGTAGSARYQDGEWHIELGGRETSHQLLRVALAAAIGAAPSSLAGFAAPILNESHGEASPSA